MKTLYVITTNQCQLSCPFCYTKFIPSFNESKEASHIDIDMAAEVINIREYDHVIFHGGEPLLYPDIVMGIMDKVKKKDVVFGIQTNLAFKDLSKDQLKCLYRMKHGYGTSYSIDRFPDDILKNNIIHNIHMLNTVGIRSNIIVTITEDQINKQNPYALKSFLDSLDTDYIIFERPILPINTLKTEYKKCTQLYEEVDKYLETCYKIFDRDKTNIFSLVSNSVRTNSPMYDNHCSFWTETLYYDRLKMGCPSLEKKKVDDRAKMIECLQCDYYKYCKGDCECFNYACAFPKKTFSAVLKDIRKENSNE